MPSALATHADCSVYCVRPRRAEPPALLLLPWLSPVLSPRLYTRLRRSRGREIIRGVLYYPLPPVAGVGGHIRRYAGYCDRINLVADWSNCTSHWSGLNSTVSTVCSTQYTATRRIIKRLASCATRDDFATRSAIPHPPCGRMRPSPVAGESCTRVERRGPPHSLTTSCHLRLRLPVSRLRLPASMSTSNPHLHLQAPPRRRRRHHGPGPQLALRWRSEERRHARPPGGLTVPGDHP